MSVFHLVSPHGFRLKFTLLGVGGIGIADLNPGSDVQFRSLLLFGVQSGVYFYAQLSLSVYEVEYCFLVIFI